MIALVVSRADRASEHIGEHVLDLATWTTETDDTVADADGGGTYYRRPGFELRTFDDLHLHLDDVADRFTDPSVLVFLSRHSGDTGPLLSAHFTGNFGPADYGGRDGELARACPGAQAEVVEALSTHAPDGYDVAIECTHHGPSHVGVPSMFVELGSSSEEWDDPDGAAAVARAVLSLEGVDADRTDGDATRHVVGFGGGHYAPRFLRIIRETDWAVGHIAADWPLEAMGPVDANREVIRAAFEASAADLAVVEGDYPRLSRAVADEGFRVVSETFLHATTGVSRALVARTEDVLGRVDEGLRFGAPARTAVEDVDRGFEVRSLPDDLVETALGIDTEVTRAVVTDHCLAYQSEEAGRRPVGDAALPVDGSDGSTAYDRLVDDLCTILEERFDEVSRDGDVVVAHEQAFDPDAAATLGVEAGPAFGRLANGEPVEVGGRHIDPEAVHERKTIRFRI